jgi:hypothetical protein
MGRPCPKSSRTLRERAATFAEIPISAPYPHRAATLRIEKPVGQRASVEGGTRSLWRRTQVQDLIVGAGDSKAPLASAEDETDLCRDPEPSGPPEARADRRSVERLLEAADRAAAVLDDRQYAVSRHEVRGCAVRCPDEAREVRIESDRRLVERGEVLRPGPKHVVLAAVTPKGQVGVP